MPNYEYKNGQDLGGEGNFFTNGVGAYEQREYERRLSKLIEAKLEVFFARLSRENIRRSRCETWDDDYGTRESKGND